MFKSVHEVKIKTPMEIIIPRKVTLPKAKNTFHNSESKRAQNG